MNNNENKILQFKLEDQFYGLPLRVVKKILHAVEVKQIPDAPICLLGVANIENNSVPVLCTRILMGFNTKPISPDDCFVLISVATKPYLISADSIVGMTEYKDVLPKHFEHYINVINQNNQLIILLEIENVLLKKEKEIQQINKLVFHE